MLLPNDFFEDSTFYLNDLDDYATDDEHNAMEAMSVKSIDDIYWLLRDNYKQIFIKYLPTFTRLNRESINELFAQDDAFDIVYRLRHVDFGDELLVEGPHKEGQYGEFSSVKNSQEFFKQNFDLILNVFVTAWKQDLL